MGDMKHYVTEQELFCIKENSIYPQDIQKTENVYLTFGTIGLTCTKRTKNGQKTNLLNKYGVYYELGNAWNLSLYT